MNVDEKCCQGVNRIRMEKQMALSGQIFFKEYNTQKALMESDICNVLDKNGSVCCILTHCCA